MDKLTARQIIQREAECVSRQQCDRDCGKCDLVMDANDILAAYAHAMELLDTEERGELVKLPCKVGDTVYSPRKNGILEQLVDYICMEEGDIYIHVSFCCDCDCDGCPHNNWQTTHEDEHYCDGEYGNGIFVVNDFGKTVFLTREEAEVALKEG